MIGRREFLALTGLAAADSSGHLRRTPRPARLNLALVGTGGRGAAFVTEASRENLVALCDVDETKLKQAADKAPRARPYRDFREMLARERELHGLVIAAPDHTHAPAAALALRKGLDVFSEKPLCHSVFEARVLARLAGAHRAVTQVGLQGQTGVEVRRAVEIVRTGGIGAVREVHAWTNRPIWPAGIDRPAGETPCPPSLDWDLWLGPAPHRPHHTAYHPFKWRSWWDFGTGAIGDMGSHILWPVFRALDLQAPSTVEAEGPPPHPESVPAWTIVRFEFPGRGERPPVRLTWYDGRKLPPEELFGGRKVEGNGSLFVGESGTLQLMNEQGTKFVALTKDGAEIPPVEIGASPGVFEQWVAACKTAGRTLIPFEQAGPFTEALLLANVAYRSGRKISWDAPRARTDDAASDRFLAREYRPGWSL